MAGALGGMMVLFLIKAPQSMTAIAMLALAGLVALLASGDIRRPCLALLVFTLPLHLDVHFLFTPEHHGGPPGLRITIGDILLVVLLFLWLADIAKDRRMRVQSFASITLPAGLLVVAGIISSIFAQKPLFSAFQLFELTKGIILLLYLANRIRDEADIKWIIAGLIAAVFLQSTLGIYQAITDRTLGLVSIGEEALWTGFRLGDRTATRSVGTLYGANIFAMYLGMTLPVVSSIMLVKANRILKTISGLVSLMGLVAMISALSRSAWVGMSLSAMLLVVFIPTENRSGRISRILLGLIMFLTILIIVDLFTGGLVSARLISDDRGAAQARIPLMLGALPIISDYPIFGSGLNNYRYTIVHYDPIGYLASFVSFRVVHNVFLLMAAETGFLGLGSFLWLLIALALRGIRFLRQRKRDLSAGLIVGLLASGLHLVVHNMVDYGLVGDPQIFTTFWFLAGFLVALTADPGIETGDSGNGRARDDANHRYSMSEGAL
jgi:putative inorganic carbon (HCO3(-)) transporter